MQHDPQPQMEGALVLRDCRVVVELGSPAIDGEIWIVGNRVVPPGGVPAARQHAMAGRVVAPGLIDAHVHLYFDASDDPLGAFQRSRATGLSPMVEAHALSTLWAGVTLIRDLGAPTATILGLRDAVASGQILGPRMVVSGSPITTSRGHLHELGGAAQGQEAIRTAVRTLKHAGVDVIKAVATGGGSSPQSDPGAAQFSDDEFLALVEEARSVNLPIACHAHADAGVRQAIAARVDTIEHGSYASEDSVRAMADQGIALVPTLAPALAALAQSRVPPERKRQIRDRLESRREVIRLAVKHGVRIVAGTDAGVAFTPHGEIAAEILALVDCGIPPARALAAAGREAAAALGITDAGSLTPGAQADLIVLEADPLSDPRCLRRPLAVMRAGRWVVTR